MPSPWSFSGSVPQNPQSWRNAGTRQCGDAWGTNWRDPSLEQTIQVELSPVDELFVSSKEKLPMQLSLPWCEVPFAFLLWVLAFTSSFFVFFLFLLFFPPFRIFCIYSPGTSWYGSHKSAFHVIFSAIEILMFLCAFLSFSLPELA